MGTYSRRDGQIGRHREPFHVGHCPRAAQSAGVIKSYLRYMRSGYADASETDECLGKLEQRADQLLAMLDDILELAYLKANTGPFKSAPVQAAEVLEEVVGNLQSAAEAKGLQLIVHLHGRPVVPVKPNHLRSLWTRLIDNAIRYTPEGQVIVTLDEEGGWLVATVADTGIGISDEDLRCVFQEFYRSQSARAIDESERAWAADRRTDRPAL